MTVRPFGARFLAAVVLFAKAASSAEPASAEAGARTSLVWIYGDDDAFGPPDARVPPSPAASIGDRPGYDPLAVGFRSRYTGRENRVELHLRGAAPGFFRGLSTRAELAVGIDASALGERGEGPFGAPVRAEDTGSFVEARFASSDDCSVPSARAVPAVLLRLYPLDGDRERVGSLEALTWGGESGPRRESPYATARGPVRAARLELEAPVLAAFLGIKTASFLEPVPNAPAIEETSYGFFGGLRATPGELFLLELAGGSFEHGVLERSSRGARAVTSGGSARFAVRRGMDEPRSPVVWLGPTDDPFEPNREVPPGAFSVGVEAAALVQRLGDFDRPGHTALAPARGLVVYGGARLGRFEVSGAVMLRDPEFVMRNVPGVFPGLTIPRAVERATERTLLLTNGVEPSELVRADLALALRFPAAVMLGALDRLGQPTGATLVLNAPGDVALLPPGAVPVPVFEARPSLELRLSALLSAVGWLAYRRDYNRTRLVTERGEGVARGFVEPNRFGYGIAARALW